MAGLLVRLLLLLAAVFGVAYAVTRALRQQAHSREVKRIQEQVRALVAGLEQGLYSDDEYERLSRKLQLDCAEAGIALPELPRSLNPAAGAAEGDVEGEDSDG